MTKKTDRLAALMLLAALLVPGLARGEDGGVDGGQRTLQQLLAMRPPPSAYQGPKVTSPLAPVETPPETDLAAVQVWYASEIEQRFAPLRVQVGKADAGAYQQHLAELSSRAQACADSLPAGIAAAATAFQAAKSTDEEWPTFRAIMKLDAGTLVPDTASCIAATFAKWTPQGVLLSGQIYDPTEATGRPLAKITSLTGSAFAFAFVLWPQVVTAWPGRTDAPTAILDPQQGPFKVLKELRLAKGEPPRSPWRRSTVTVSEYLEYKSNTYLLVANSDGQPVGWLSQDECAYFFNEDWPVGGPPNRSVKAEAELYTTGVAAFLHGTWWRPEGNHDDPSRCRISGACLFGMLDITTYDFLLRHWFIIPPPPVERRNDPYSDVMKYGAFERCRLNRSSFELKALGSACSTTGGVGKLSNMSAIIWVSSHANGEISISRGSHLIRGKANHFKTSVVNDGNDRKFELGKIRKIKHGAPAERAKGE